MDIDTFVLVSSSIFTKSFAVALGLICTFRTKVLFVCVFPWCLNLRTIVCTDERDTFRCLEIAPKDEPDFGGIPFFSEVLADFL